jgi:hypothetical protein
LKPQHILLIIICAMVFALMNMAKNPEPETKPATQTKACDSIRDENLELQIELGRYQVALEILRAEDSAAEERIRTIIETQTE